MGNSIDIGGLSQAIADTLSQYTQEVAEGVKKAADESMKELVADTKAAAPKRTGKYRKAIKSKTLHEDNFEKRNRWYVDPKTGKYRLSHLLEKGHNVVRSGSVIGRAKPYPHIDRYRVKALANFEERVKEAIKNASK